jgi:hypothetical protein
MMVLSFCFIVIIDNFLRTGLASNTGALVIVATVENARTFLTLCIAVSGDRQM